MRLFLLLSLLSLTFAHRSIAQTIVIRQGDFASAASAPGVADTNLTGAPMRIIPNIIGRPERRPAQSSGNIPPGLLVPRTGDAPAVTPTLAAGTTTALLSVH
jgi:hypothetical protein